ncbi:MAG: hypothetical protein V7607_5460 [Solirubrobacteraceae bacterium]
MCTADSARLVSAPEGRFGPTASAGALSVARPETTRPQGTPRGDTAMAACRPTHPPRLASRHGTGTVWRCGATGAGDRLASGWHLSADRADDLGVNQRP